MTVMADLVTADTAAWDDGGETAVVDDMPIAAARELAWSCDDNDATVDSRRSWTAALCIAASLAIAAVLAIAGLTLLRTPDDRAVAPPVAPKSEAPKPAAPVPPMIDGVYRLDYRWSETSFQNSKHVDWSTAGNVPSEWYAFASSCTASGCIATGTYLDQASHAVIDPAGTTMVLRLADNVWSDVSPRQRHNGCTFKSDGFEASSVESFTMSLDPLPDGSFRGSLTMRTETNECGDMGSAVITPVALTRVGPLPEGLFTPQTRLAK